MVGLFHTGRALLRRALKGLRFLSRSQDVERFFIAGCQRTGTTLMRLILECHPRIHCFDELTSYAVLSQGRHEVPRGKHLAGFKIPRWTETLGDNPAWDEGMPERACGVYRGEPIVFMIRDVRDTVASMFKLRMTEQHNWLEFCARPILEGKMRPGELRTRFAHDLAIVRRSGNAPHLVGALYWKYKTDTYYEYRRRGWPTCPVRYEDLVTAPEVVLRRVLAFLRMPWDARLLQHHRCKHSELLPDGKAIGNTDPSRPIDADSVGQWRQAFTRQQEDEILEIAGELNANMHAEALKELGPVLRVESYRFRLDEFAPRSGCADNQKTANEKPARQTGPIQVRPQD